MGYRAQAYADDPAIVVVGNHLNMVTNLMQSSFRVADSQCRAKRPFVDLQKTEVVLYIRKKKTDGIVRLTYDRVELNLTMEVKFLGTLHDKPVTIKTWNHNTQTGRFVRVKACLPVIHFISVEKGVYAAPTPPSTGPFI